MSATPLPDKPITEFRTLFELCRLAGHEPENPVSIPSLVTACDLARDEFNDVVRTLKQRQLIVFDTLLDYLRITHFGVSEIVSAKARPNLNTHYFPSLKMMGIRLRQGHHLFDSVEPVWPKNNLEGGQSFTQQSEGGCGTDSNSEDLHKSINGIELDLQPLINELEALKITLFVEHSANVNAHSVNAQTLMGQLEELEWLVQVRMDSPEPNLTTDAQRQLPGLLNELPKLICLLESD